MRRFFRLYLPLLILAVLAAGYTAYWEILSQRVQRGLDDWATAQRARGYEVHWQDASVGGFPLTLQIHATDFALALPGSPSRLRLATPDLVGRAWPWRLWKWNLASDKGTQLTFPVGTVDIAALGATVTLSSEGTEIDAALHDLTGAFGGSYKIKEADASLSLPPRPPAGHLDTAGTLDLRIIDWTLPKGVPPLGDTIASLDLATTLKGAIPASGGLTAWRDDGGTLEIGGFSLKWGALGATGNGTLALDGDMKPIGALTTSLEGQDAIVDALTGSGSIRPSDASLLKIALGLLAKQDADGKKHIVVPTRMQGGRLYLGPIGIANLPALSD